jgi:hypothetical protein
MLVAEIKFPLPALETPADGGGTTDPSELRTQRLNALVHALEAQVVDESAVCLMEKGSDDRSIFHGEQRLNKYFTGWAAADTARHLTAYRCPPRHPPHGIPVLATSSTT